MSTNQSTSIGSKQDSPPITSSQHDSNLSNAHLVNSDFQDEEEELHQASVLNAINHYGEWHGLLLQKRARDLEALTLNKTVQRQFLLELYQTKLRRVGYCVLENAKFLKNLVKENLFGEDIKLIKLKDELAKPTTDDMEKVQTILKMITRDWSKEGLKERLSTYTPIVKELLNFYEQVKIENRYQLKILVPGAGLGRLAYDIVSLGFSCQGNEFSYYMLIASSFMLNQSTVKDKYTIYPYCTQFSNQVNLNNQLYGVQVPDTTVSVNNPNTEFSMIAGEFVEIYNTVENKNSWDGLVTCYFLDTARNILDYIQLIYYLLKPGAIWINLGPLLYHYDGIIGDRSIELTYEEIKPFIIKCGFIIKNEKFLETTYTTNQHSMLNSTYKCIMFTCIKPIEAINYSIALF